MEELETYTANFFQSDWLHNLVWAAIIVAATAVAAHLLSSFLRHLLDRTEGGLPASSIFVNIGRSVVWLLGGSIMLDTCFGVNVSAVIAALGVGGIAISLGFQDTISNLIGGLQVSLMRIVQPGDNIEVGGQLGEVKDVTWRHTTITNSMGETIVIPNSVINKSALVHLPPVRRVKVPFVVTTDGQSLPQLKQRIIQDATQAARQVGAVEKEATILFSEVTEYGFRGSLFVLMEDAAVASEAKSAIVQAIAPLTRP